jgi:AraC-like DNA-binding protein
MRMLWQTTSHRGCDLLDKQALIERVLSRFEDEIAPPTGDLPREVRTMLVYIHEHLFSWNLNATAVRRGCRLRNNNVTSRFRCAVGVGLREYIEAGRVAAAKRLLRHPDLEIYLIAMAVGYEHPETFCRAFRRRSGCTPSVWRSFHCDKDSG